MKYFQVLSLLSLAFLSACSPKASDDASLGKAELETAAALPAIEMVEGVTIVRIDGNDRMQFTVTEFAVKTGDTVRIIFTNKGNMPKTAMGHNVVVLKKDVDGNAFAGKAALARDTDFIPLSEAGSIVAHTKLLGPDESDTIEFVAPAPGKYEFLCSFPAHCFAGMRGVMTIEP
ncbi:MAG: plastocyanin/azurin family copper-binding protein [Opitutaceae bacterium]